MKTSHSRLFELLWLLAFLGSTYASFQETSKNGFRSAILFYIIAILSLAMLLFRLYLRKTDSKSAKSDV